MSKKIIWALFDDGNGSWNKCDYDKEEFEIISVGINDNPDWKNYLQQDLRTSNFDLIKNLSKLPKPDIIIASPPCESWSQANNQQRIYRKIEKEEDEIDGIKIERKMVEFFSYADTQANNEKFGVQLKRDWFKGTATMIMGLDTLNGLLRVIHHFQPKVWVIENPQSSKMWEYIEEFSFIKKDENYYNDAYYNCYNDDFSKKPTRFYSNIEMSLKKFPKKATINMGHTCGYDKRAAIPPELLLDILSQIKTKIGLKK
ncbi:MAG: DNA cytosine methyltransferase [Mycoplasma sp.]